MNTLITVHCAVCPVCRQRVTLNGDGTYAKHALYTDRLAKSIYADGICDGSGQKADPDVLRDELRKNREIDAINQRHHEMHKLRKELAPAAAKLLAHQSLKAAEFAGLLKAYGLWDNIPPRRKNTIKDNLRCLQYDGATINFIMHGKRTGSGLLPLAKDLLSALARSKA